MCFALRKKEEKRRKAKWEGERMKGEDAPEFHAQVN